jgi:integrase
MSTQTPACKTKPDKRQPWPKISRVKHKNGTTAWLVDGRIAGKGERCFFKTRVEADTKAEQLRATRKNEGAESLALPSRLRAEAADCARKLAAVGATLSEAVAFYLRHAKPASGPKTITAVVDAFLKAKTQAGRRPSYLEIQRCVLGYFGKTFGEREIHTVGSGEISEWMLAQPWALRTRLNYQRDIGNLYGFAIKHGFCATNPTERLEKITLDDKPPGILTIAQASRLLDAAERTEGGVMLPYVAIGLFSGLRASELAALDWSEVSLAERTIEVVARKAKTRARRIVTMSDNLAEWLQPYARTSGPVASTEGLAEKWERVRAAAKIDPWPKNALRHSFASYHVAAHKNAPHTSLEMGHDNPQQLFAAYRELVKPTDAAKYWTLRPAKTDAVIAFAA